MVGAEGISERDEGIRKRRRVSVKDRAWRKQGALDFDLHRPIPRPLHHTTYRTLPARNTHLSSVCHKLTGDTYRLTNRDETRVQTPAVH